MLTNGYIKLHRSLLDWEWYSDKNTLCLFLHLLLRVHYKDAVWKNSVRLERGSMLTSVQALARETGLTVAQTRCALKHLRDSKEITTRTTNQYTVISVVRYDFFQGQDSDGSKQISKRSDKRNDNQAANETTTREETEEIKKSEEELYALSSAHAYAQGTPEYRQVVESFNRICTSLPQVSVLSDKRRQAIRAAAQTAAGFGGWEKLFRTVEQSDFLTGRSGSWRGCSFDWILKPANLVKITEGNYANRNDRKGESYDGMHIGTTV